MLTYQVDQETNSKKCFFFFNWVVCLTTSFLHILERIIVFPQRNIYVSLYFIYYNLQLRNYKTPNIFNNLYIFDLTFFKTFLAIFCFDSTIFYFIYLFFLQLDYVAFIAFTTKVKHRNYT